MGSLTLIVKMIVTLLLGLILTSPIHAGEIVHLSAILDKNDGQISLQEGLHTGSSVIGHAKFENSMYEKGWSPLEIISTETNVTDDARAYAAGMLEGSVTAELIYQHWRNQFETYCDGEMRQIRELTEDFLDENDAWVKGKIDEARKLNNNGLIDDSYWYHANLFNRQMQGIGAGYRKAAGEKNLPILSDSNIRFMNIFGDMEDLEEALKSQFNLDVNLPVVLGDGRCSALIKLLPNNSDLYVSQVAWTQFNAMTRISKRYHLAYKTSDTDDTPVPGQDISFSGYPGIIYSGDDFHIINPSRLTTLETTTGNYNNSLWKYVTSNDTMLEGVRVMIANRLANNGSQWANLFKDYNSGTYNNQWMIVDYKLFTPGQSIDGVNGLLWVIEQLPGLISGEDRTKFLRDNTYWPSFNIPYDKTIWNMSRLPDMVETQGDWWTWEKHPRNLIFQRDHKNITDLKTMEKMMRYNDFKHDPLSKCSPCNPPYSAENGISARSDLNDPNGTYAFPALEHHNHGGTDMKLTSFQLSKYLMFIYISSPTYDDQPYFQWSKADFKDSAPHYGLPDLWNFTSSIIEWTSDVTTPSPTTPLTTVTIPQTTSKCQHVIPVSLLIVLTVMLTILV